MTSRRTLGGGRVLGSGRSLSTNITTTTTNSAAPAATTTTPRLAAQHRRNASLLSPSESSVSLSSQASNSPASTVETREDIGSKVLLGPGESAAASASSKLVCPICNEEMVTLLQLNRHLDDNHQNLVEEEQDEVKNWFEAQMDKAKKFQPLAVLNQKLKGLDVFESNDAPTPPPLSNSSRSTSAPTLHDAPAPVRRDPDEEVTRKHWQRPGNRDVCLEPTCAKPITASQIALGGREAAVNCRQCGKLFCEEHTMYQMKLSRQAKHEPVRGIWCRVCETCYKSREGYNDHHAAERNHFDEFANIRRKRVDREHMEVSRLEKRLSKLTSLLANPPPEETLTASSWFAIPGAKNQRKVLEQSIITWEEDAKVSNCPFCQQEFSTYTFRRHHCRMCGRVVCGDPKTGCSAEVGLNVASGTSKTEKDAGQMSVDIRMCQDCQHTLFSRRDFDRELADKPKDQRAYENLAQFERGIRLLLPRFQKLLQALQDPDKPPTPQQLTDATKVRKRLMDAFAQFDAAAKRIRDLPTDSPTQKRLQNAVYQQAYSFLSLHMLPLRSLPRILKHAVPQGSKNNGPSNGGGALAAIKFNDKSAGSVVSSSEVSAMESEERELRERLIVLEEQKFMVSEMVADATKHRRFDEVSSLAQNVEDLNQEIDQINGQLGQLDFAGAYQGIMATPSPG
ncbi:vacuolar segregation protein-like protein pep7 [Dothidotthia symphoricarpi CBS 119687]|uniref:Vacuolar segregation protein-like protein pep7 n=1 Tax=Dothidotthia symphoricarpi CBS 119687 TaxID=1392245 RepID=A0A6A6A9I4_9PLEO|nr:vacuolar segregation protein-like protein pep7 [Dothidotthia symphoricarpi CBS 119687]KAF2127497.1 vacuolar segregation protein-like protein pep7 [Dothidotthia symphoricarpi CBS 119687]